MLSPSDMHMRWFCLGSVLVTLHVAMALISREFWHGRDILERPVTTLVALMFVSGIAYIFAVALVRRSFVPGNVWWVGMLVVGAAMRVTLLPSLPMLDDDHYRYLWEGGQVAQGASPYGSAPADALASSNARNANRQASTAHMVARRVNHPELRTIYPPVAQIAFAIAHFVAPWSIDGLKAVWLVADIATFGLLAMLLRSANFPLKHLLIYWWNPLLIKETYNSAHMDILVLPFLVGALVLIARNRHLLASFAIALAAGVKLWPVLVLPATLRYSGLSFRSTLLAATVFVAITTTVTAPLLLDAPHVSSGLFEYARGWEMNDSLYIILRVVGSWIAPNSAHIAARILLALILVGMTTWVCRVPASDVGQVCTRILYLASALFLLSPTQFPWYWIWLLPLLTAVPVNAMLLLTVTLPLYYLRFTMDATGHSHLFDYGVVWIEFGPTLALLAWTALQSARNHASLPHRLDLAHER